MKCDNCGLCCKELIIEATVLDVLREPRIAEECRHLDGHGKIPLMESAWSLTHCPFLGADNLCSIYPTRPNECVGFVAGCEKCLELRAEHDLPPLVEQDLEVVRCIDAGFISEDGELNAHS